jgi:hypothetical protein
VVGYGQKNFRLRKANGGGVGGSGAANPPRAEACKNAMYNVCEEFVILKTCVMKKNQGFCKNCAKMSNQLKIPLLQVNFESFVLTNLPKKKRKKLKF